MCVNEEACRVIHAKTARCGNLLFPSQCHVSIQHTAHHETVGPNIGAICWMNRTYIVEKLWQVHSTSLYTWLLRRSSW